MTVKTSCLLGMLWLLSGCGALTVPERNTAAGVAVATIAGRSPSASIEQIYYLGVFDPQDQVPPALYRVRVRGQGSTLSPVKFGSYWVPSGAIDSIASDNDLAQKAGIQATQQLPATMLSGRRLVLFGPEGFREAPKDHRLVILMGSSIENFTQAVDTALGTVASVRQGSNTSNQFDQTIFEALIRLANEREQLKAIP